jgi:hypothetical protein
MLHALLSCVLRRLVVARPLSVLALTAALAASGCSSKSEGDVACDGGVCQPKPVLANGFLSSLLVTPRAVYVAEKSTCGVYGGDKPLRTVTMLAKNACGVAAMARTDGALFWTTAPMATEKDKNPKGMLVMVADDDPKPIVIDATLERPRGIAALGGDTLYVAVADGIRKLAPGSTQLERALDLRERGPQTLRAFDGALYWHDGFRSIYRWRPGEAKPSTLVEGADIRPRSEVSPANDPFEVDGSGIYWMSDDLFGAGSTLEHAALGGGIPGTMLAPKGYVTALALDTNDVFWSEADSFLFTKNTAVHRTKKSDLGTSVVIGSVPGAVEVLQMAVDGLYIAATPSVLDFDFEKSKFQSYSGPLLVLPRAVLDTL